MRRNGLTIQRLLTFYSCVALNRFKTLHRLALAIIFCGVVLKRHNTLRRHVLRVDYVKALSPVMALPTIKLLICLVPS